MTNQEFIKLIGTAAQQDWTTHKILPSLTVAQAILESSWGTSGLTIKGKNLFGMKCGDYWRGKVCTMRTREEHKDGTEYFVNAPFRAYDTWLECIQDHGEFLKTSRYVKVRGETNYKKACVYIKDAGYATDTKYVSKLVTLIQMYKLYEFDDIATTKKEETVKAASISTTYIVKKGDSLFKIAKAYKTTIEKLVALNGIKTADIINIGQVIKIK